MRWIGQLCLLAALVGTGYAAWACVLGYFLRRVSLQRSGVAVAVASFMALSVTMMGLTYGLLVKDFRFAYVAQYSNRLLPWQYSIASLWVGQAGSLLLWTWMTAGLALLFRAGGRRKPTRDSLHELAFGVVMAFCFFLVITMVFAADPMAPSLDVPEDGAGLNPVLQHPSMLIHPPIVFLGYSAWAIPFSLAVATLLRGDSTADWIRSARPWSLFAWTVLGSGILMGAHWAYGELGWGGYWSWDPVENGSLIPWLIGTTAIHTQMTWRRRGMLKKSALATTIATFAMCNFATFLTRSGIFSSVHAFSQSPIGWLFLGLMAVIAVGGVWLIVVRRDRLQTKRGVESVLTREAMVIATTAALLVFALVVCVGTLSAVISDALINRKVVVGMSFYNRALIASGFLVLLLMAAAPLVGWGRGPSKQQALLLMASAAAGAAAAAWSAYCGVWQPVCQAINGLAVFAIVALAAAFWLDVRQRSQRGVGSSGVPTRRGGALTSIPPLRRRYAGFMIHLGVASLAVGVAASSLRTARCEVIVRPGQSLNWGGRQVKFVELAQRQLPDKLVVEARLDLRDGTGRRTTLAPAQHFHVRQQEWTNEVDYDATWRGDFYAILHGAEHEDAVRMTFVINPMMRWIWLGGWIMAGGAIVAMLPDGRVRARLRTQTPLRVEQSTCVGDLHTSRRSGVERPAA